MSSVGAVLASKKLGLGQEQHADAAGASAPAWIKQLLCICGTSNGVQQHCMEGISFYFFNLYESPLL